MIYIEANKNFLGNGTPTFQELSLLGPPSPPPSFSCFRALDRFRSSHSYPLVVTPASLPSTRSRTQSIPIFFNQYLLPLMTGRSMGRRYRFVFLHSSQNRSCSLSTFLSALLFLCIHSLLLFLRSYHRSIIFPSWALRSESSSKFFCIASVRCVCVCVCSSRRHAKTTLPAPRVELAMVSAPGI